MKDREKNKKCGCALRSGEEQRDSGAEQAMQRDLKTTSPSRRTHNPSIPTLHSTLIENISLTL
jgi:hypothetical protein